MKPFSLLDRIRPGLHLLVIGLLGGLSLLLIVRQAKTTLKRLLGALKVALEELNRDVITLILNRQIGFLIIRAATTEWWLLAARLCDCYGGERHPHDQEHDWNGTREETDAEHVSDPPFPGRQ